MWRKFGDKIEGMINHPDNKHLKDARKQVEEEVRMRQEEQKRADEEARMRQEEQKRAEEAECPAEDLARQLAELKAQLSQTKGKKPNDIFSCK
ncbi:hypothetical protein AX14_009191 [Amanita brunnescens Koide BX004]|nr:hypothetical protein AX14_009191 [Amanita brunnescens Koide BX004]